MCEESGIVDAHGIAEEGRSYDDGQYPNITENGPDRPEHRKSHRILQNQKERILCSRTEILPADRDLYVRILIQKLDESLEASQVALSTLYSKLHHRVLSSCCLHLLL